ncbi:hypothetical protein C1645_834982 [Glomus cerebriforme]|uniref:Uncharacterized protein n=1 Tax=Glomus cerebriforme TaxID=658196 RepID=A0A397S9Q0_9GLOM|nr:hypothetical protein C1645_834982 [Glomus cerebriforme]
MEVANAYVQVGSGKVGNACIRDYDKKYKDQENLLKATETLNRLIQQDSNITKHLKERCDDNKVLFKDLKQNILNETYNECTGSLKNLKDNTKQVINFSEQRRIISNNLIVLAKNLLNNLETKNVLSSYRDYISSFNRRLKGRLDANVWNRAYSAVNKKVETEMANYSGSERDDVSNLKNELDNVHLTLEEYELLILIKYRSICEFHRNRYQTRTEARKKLEDSSFPKDMEVFKNVLDKLFKALDLLDA